MIAGGGYGSRKTPGSGAWPAVAKRSPALARPGGHVRFALRAIDAGGRCRERQGRWYALLAELRGPKPGVSVTLDNWPALPPSPDLTKLSPEQMDAFIATMRQARSIVERAGGENWTPGDSTTWARPNGAEP